MIINQHNELLWGNARLPSAYQEVEYIGTAGPQYIDTGVNPSGVYESGINYEMSVLVPSGTGYAINYLWGCSNGGKRSGNCSLEYYYFGGISDARFMYTGVGDGVKHTITAFTNPNNYDSARLTISGIVVTTIGTSTGSLTTQPNANIYLMRCNGIARDGVPSQVYYFKMSDADGNLIRDFVPCYKKATETESEEIGMYDLVSKTFFTNAGTGTFTKGADVN